MINMIINTYDQCLDMQLLTMSNPLSESRLQHIRCCGSEWYPGRLRIPKFFRKSVVVKIKSCLLLSWAYLLENFTISPNISSAKYRQKTSSGDKDSTCSRIFLIELISLFLGTLLYIGSIFFGAFTHFTQLICCLMSFWQTLSIASSNLFWTVFDVPRKTVAFFRCPFIETFISATKFTSSRNTPGFSELSVSSCPRSANSKAPQKRTQFINWFKICLFLSTFSLCLRMF
jgi:hypothetical protein